MVNRLLLLAGMIPLARELIKNGTFVVLAANEVPALNDITAPELEVCTYKLLYSIITFWLPPVSHVS